MKTIDRHQAHIQEVIQAHRAWYGLRTEGNPRPRSIGGFTKNQLDDLPGKRAKHFYMGGMKLYPIMGASPGTFYIDPLNGNDAAAGDSANPWKTLQKGNDGSVAGDIVNVGGQADYTADNQGGAIDSRMLTASKQLTWQPWSGTGTPTITGLETDDGTGWTLHSGNIYKKADASADNDHRTVVFEDGVRLTLFRFQNGDAIADLIEGSFISSGSNLYIWANGSGSPGTNGKTYLVSYYTGLRFNAGAANSIWDGVDLRIMTHNPRIFGDGDSGHFRMDGCDGMTFKNVLIYQTSAIAGKGIVRTENAQDITIDTCTWDQNTFECLHFHGETGMVVQNCEFRRTRFYYNLGYERSVGSATQIINTGTFQDNLCHDIGGFDGGPWHDALAIEELSTGGVACVVQWNKLYNAKNGVWMSRMDGGKFLYNEMYDAKSFNSIRAEGSADLPNNWEVYHNVLWGSAQYGIVLRTDSATHSTGWTFKNNIFGENSSGHISLSSTTGQVLDYNCYHAGAGTNQWSWGGTTYTTFATWKSGSAQDANGIEADPLFVDEAARDFHLVS